MNIHYFQHVPFEGLGHLEHWVQKPGHKVTATRFYEDHKLPFVEICDLLIVLGGPMSSNDEEQLPWLTEEKRFIEKAIVRGKTVIGICLGAQLIADVLGAQVYKNPVKEIGWMPIELTEEGKKSALFKDFPKEQTVFQWHGETFDLPSGAVHIAQSKDCPNQAFMYGKNVVGLQFHLESTADSIGLLLDHCAADLTPGPSVQSIEQIRKQDFILQNNLEAEKLMDRLASMR
jgi:GMP synthase-like glutamine amidotransferase